eukprot:676703-Amphidinium_carterae.2
MIQVIRRPKHHNHIRCNPPGKPETPSTSPKLGYTINASWPYQSSRSENPCRGEGIRAGMQSL